MAISYVGGKTVGIPGTTSDQVISLTDLTGGSNSAPSDGDLVVLAYSTGSGAGQTAHSIVTSGYSSFLSSPPIFANDNDDTTTIVFGKFMTTTPDTSVTVSGTTSTVRAGCVAVMVFRGVTAAALTAGAATPASGINTGKPNAPSVTPTIAGSVVVYGGAAAANTSITVLSSGGDSTVFIAATQADDVGVTNAMAYATWTSGAFDPNGFNGGTTAGTSSWTAWSLVLPPQIAYTITASGGSYALSGTAANFRRALTVVAAAGSYGVSGTVVTLRRGYRLACAVGSYALNGVAANFRKALKIAALAGSYALTGTAALFRRSYNFSVGTGSYLLSGADAEFSANLRNYPANPVPNERTTTVGAVGKVVKVQGQPARLAVLPPLSTRMLRLARTLRAVDSE